MVTYCNNIFQNKIRFSYYNNTNKVIHATILIDVINLSYYYNKKQPTDAMVLVVTSIIFVVAILLVVTCLFSYSAIKSPRERQDFTS